MHAWNNLPGILVFTTKKHYCSIRYVTNYSFKLYSNQSTDLLICRIRKNWYLDHCQYESYFIKDCCYDICCLKSKRIIFTNKQQVWFVNSCCFWNYKMWLIMSCLCFVLSIAKNASFILSQQLLFTIIICHCEDIIRMSKFEHQIFKWSVEELSSYRI